MSPMCDTSKMPTPLRTALCSAIMPPACGYSTGMSQPLKSTIFAAVWRWTALSAVLRIVGVVAETADKGPSIRVVGDAETSYPNMGVAGASTWDALNLFHVVRRGLGRFAPFYSRAQFVAGRDESSWRMGLGGLKVAWRNPS